MRDEFGKQANFGVLKQFFTRKHRKRRRFQSLSLKSPAAACWSSVSDLAPFHSVQQTTLRLEFNFIICFCKLEKLNVALRVLRLNEQVVFELIEKLQTLHSKPDDF
jgi:hypothetical protein